MKIKQYIKRILVFSFAFILGVVAVIKTAQFQESKTAKPQVASMQKFDVDPDPEIVALKEKRNNLSRNRCRVDYEECFFSSIYDVQYFLEDNYLEFQIELIKSKKEGFSQERIKAIKSRLRGIENGLKKNKSKIKKFEEDVLAGKIDRKSDGEMLKYLEKYIQN